MKASLQGIDLDKEMGKGDEIKKIDKFKFGAPEDYEHLSEKEKQKLTERMMGLHRKKVVDVMSGG